jgi:WD40 repeat protein
MEAGLMSSATSARNPFPGLRPFRAEESTLFFGRDDQTGEALDRLLRQKMLAVVGVSGCGKSSLVIAGMVPALEMGLAGDLEQRWRVATMRPGDGPLLELRRCLDFGGEALAERTYGLLEAVETHLPADENLLLVVDQFEEIFPFRDRTLREGAGSEADLFVSNLLRAAADPAGRVHVLLTMRSDYLGECAKFHGLPEALNDGQYLVPRMTRPQLQEAIEGPLKAAGVEIHPALVQDLLNQCDEEPDNLPLLQHLLRRIFEQWEEDGEQGPITAAMAKNVGGLAGALDFDAEKVYCGLSVEERRFAEVLFRRITESRRADRDDEERPVRRPQTVADLARLARVSETVLRDMVRRFEESGLLTVRKTDRGEKVDLPHECLCLKWLRLKEWIRSEAEDAKKLRFLLDAVGKSHLTGLALSEALEWQRDGRLDAEWCLRYLGGKQMSGAREREIIDDWIDRSEEREKTKLRSAEARELSAWAAFNLSEDPECTLILGLYSWGKQRAMVGGLEQFLHDAVLRSAARLTLRGHRDCVWSIAWSPDGSKLATASWDKTAKVWEAGTGRELHTLDGHQDRVWSIAWSPDGSKLATASADKTAKVWEAGTGRELLTLRGHQDSVQSIAWSPDGSKLATASADKTAKVWEAGTGRELLTLRGHQDPVQSIAWSPDGSKLATASWDKTANVWEAGTGRELLTLRGHQSPVWSIAWSPDGSKLATASDDKTAKVWEAGAGRELLTLHGHQCSVQSIAWSPDGSKLATASDDRTAKVWETGADRELLTLRPHHQDNVQSIAWSPDGSKLATASYDQTARVWEAGVWEAGTGRELLTLGVNQDKVVTIAWSPDGSKLATAGGDNKATVWEAGAGRKLLTLRGHQGWVKSIAWSPPDGSKLATASDDHTAKVWEAETGRELLTLRGHQVEVLSIAWSPDGSKLATASDDQTAKVWEAGTSRELLTLHGHEASVRCVAWSPDGSKLATASADHTAKVWEAGTGRELLTLRGHQDAVQSIAWSPDGSKLATASADHTAKVWEAGTGRELLTLRGHQDPVQSIAWSPDGSKLATASADHTAKVWEAGTGRELLTLRGHQDEVLSIAWSPDGSKLATTSDDNTAQIYAFAPLQLLLLVRSRITRDLTPDECRRYLASEVCPPLPDVA